ncbi:hypothetical protein [Dokdonella sp.]|uniref:hypothetical protein n=1 Tax=Dokdonella sp. TaxID=2291710 RepID=UPI003C4218C4
MTDGFHGMEPCADPSSSDDGFDTRPFAHATRVPPTPAAPEPCLTQLAEWLPQLGPVLWLERPVRAEDREACKQPSSTLLLDHPALAVLSATTRLSAHHAITAHGPREWFCFHSPNGTVQAKLFLLPDSDVLAWDEMSSALHIVPSEANSPEPPTHHTLLRRALNRLGQSWQARLLEFNCVRRPWLSVLDARPPLRISLLGIDIARGIVRDVHAEWISPLHFS